MTGITTDTASRLGPRFSSHGCMVTLSLSRPYSTLLVCTLYQAWGRSEKINTPYLGDLHSHTCYTLPLIFPYREKEPCPACNYWLRRRAFLLRETGKKGFHTDLDGLDCNTCCILAAPSVLDLQGGQARFCCQQRLQELGRQ